MTVDVSINCKCELVAVPDILADEELERINLQVYNMLNRCHTLDNTPLDEGVYVEFLISPKIKTEDTLAINYERKNYVQKLPSDGMYIYYCIKTYDSKDIQHDIEEGFRGLYYDSNNQTLMFQNEKVTDYELLVNSLPVLINEKEGVSDYCEHVVFSICQLKKCITTLQKESFKECNSNKCDSKSEELFKLRDLLFISIYILESLICQERYQEAIDVLESISSCGYICDNISYKKSTCNCNK